MQGQMDGLYTFSNSNSYLLVLITLSFTMTLICTSLDSMDHPFSSWTLDGKCYEHPNHGGTHQVQARFWLVRHRLEKI